MVQGLDGLVVLGVRGDRGRLHPSLNDPSLSVVSLSVVMVVNFAGRKLAFWSPRNLASFSPLFLGGLHEETGRGLHPSFIKQDLALDLLLIARSTIKDVFENSPADVGGTDEESEFHPDG